ncbi:quinol monooxygenase YgiN [Kitasatospora sp. MAP12-15]|uniref:antibiotic biosynthesis monooxygenase n=1 Tax=unclassified Kitasatospora TaxID=2633591 RepID=UPI002474E745|nr:antibiotic biosynthesis monooxygenase [Kitasatospora sp. MAP12-44]MDH6108122.1 quinol monooxygenase YgiN [Kitasatospora sp. MAP12-44]
MTTGPIPPTAVVRVSRGNFDPARFPEVQEATAAISGFLIPAIKELPGLISYHWATSPDGSLVNVSIWESDEHAEQMSRLTEMTVDARAITEKAGVVFIPIVNYPIDWTI